jgi:hypothetical protein
MSEKQSTQDIILFQSQGSAISLPVQIDEETVWLTQSQMMTLFDTTKQNVSLHINNCFREGELDKNSVVKDSLTTATAKVIFPCPFPSTQRTIPHAVYSYLQGGRLYFSPPY